MALIGRRAECELLDGVLADALAGRSRVVVLRGEAGAARARCSSYLVERAVGWHVATARRRSSRRWSSPTAGCTSSARRCSITSSAPDPAARCARDGVRPERGAAPTGSWSGSPR